MFAEYTRYDDASSITVVRENNEKVTYYGILGALIDSIDFCIEDVDDENPLGTFQCWGNDYGAYPFRVGDYVFDITPIDLAHLNAYGIVDIVGIVEI